MTSLKTFKCDCLASEPVNTTGLFGLPELHLFHPSFEMLTQVDQQCNKGISGKPKSPGEYEP